MSARDDSRKRFPHCSAVIDDFRAAFGELVVVKVQEGDQLAVSKKFADDSAMKVMSAAEFLEIGALDRSMLTVRDKAKRGVK